MTKLNAISGLTLVEFIIVTIILTIVAIVAIPNFIQQLHAREAHQFRTYITSAFKIAKTHSLLHHRDIIMCPADMHNQCNRNSQHQILIFDDKDNDKNYDPSQDIIISKKNLALKYGRTYMRVSRGAHYIKFFGDTGHPRGHFGHFKYCPNDATTQNMFQISINKFGRSRYKPHSYKDTQCP